MSTKDVPDIDDIIKTEEFNLSANRHMGGFLRSGSTAAEKGVRGGRPVEPARKEELPQEVRGRGEG